MPVDKAAINKYLDELGLSPEARTAVLGDFEKNETAATQFVGQRLRFDDYTRKRQEEKAELERQRAEIETRAATSVQSYAEQLTAAQEKMNKIVADLEAKEISSATANARLQAVKTKYNLDDDDIPTITPPVRSETPVVTPPAADIDKKLEEMRLRIVREMTFLPDVTAAQMEIQSQHQELTGKRMTQKEMVEMVDEVRKNGGSLLNVWKTKYDIDNIAKEREFTERLKKHDEEQEALRRQKASEDAIAGIRGDSSKDSLVNPMLNRKFKTHTEGVESTPPPATRSGMDNMSGAERAAIKFAERRNRGLPIGSPEPANK